MELYKCPCMSHDISDRSFPRVSGGVIGNDHAKRVKRSLQTRWSLVRSACEGKVDCQRSVFCSIWQMWSLFAGWIEALGRSSVSAIRISQVVAFSRTHSVHLNPQIEGTEIVCPQFSGGRFCQVVTRTGSTVVEQSEKGPDLGRVAWGLVGIETKWRPTQPAAVRVEHSCQTSGFFVDPLVDPWFGLVFSTTVIAMTQRGKVQMERTGKDCDRRAQLPSRETWSQRMVSSGNPSHAKQKDLLKHVHQKRKKWKRKKHTRDVQQFFRQAWHFCCTPHGPASNRYCSKLLLHLLSLQTAVVRTSPRQVERANCT